MKVPDESLGEHVRIAMQHGEQAAADQHNQRALAASSNATAWSALWMTICDC